ncbi:autophagy-related protein 2-like isoform X2 [Zingiber officinale]|uniref:autophagy-related protein 2-like isoform X2 n=1 Tax=Zingiber officinale TaxID=94328 RepID=UPI001C4B140E|nr:autophagy-related protein 2-like isoform X2 [Zingiber officinale]
MFSRWDFSRSSVIKRVCKFLLKKKLGEVILGDIDLDQLDVQLGTGTIQLSDLALNVDFLNQKIAGAPIVVKEGSIKSLSIKVPWKLRNCEIEIDEIELVLGPFNGSCATQANADSSLPHDCQHHMNDNPDRIECEIAQDYHGSIPLDIHEGVKTIAKVVKWFLTSFHVRLNGVIVAFDPRSHLDERRDKSCRLLVLRIKETEFGTHLSEDSMSKLTNFMKFQKANVEFLEMDDIDEGLEVDNVTGRGLNGRLLNHGTTSILTGADGGFSVTLNLSIPWKNGCLDVSKVDAEVSIDPIELRIQPSSINWVIAIWNSLENTKASECAHYHKASNSFNSTYRSHTAMTNTIYLDVDADTLTRGSELSSVFSAITPETIPDALLMRTNFIHDWVPQHLYQEDPSSMVPDLSASIDQFFECFDEISSQGYSSTGSIWNWTRSVFNAISVASNLASGMGDVAKEQHVETSLRAAIAGISVIVFLGDDQHYLCGSNNLFEPLLDEINSRSINCPSSANISVSRSNKVTPVDNKMHHIEAKCHNLVLEFETYSGNTTFSASVERVKVDAYYDAQRYSTGFLSSGDQNTSNEQLFLNHHIKEKIQDSLPPFPFCISDCDSDLAGKDSTLGGISQFRLFESFGNCSCKLNVNPKGSNGLMALTSFVVNFPPFILWFHYNLVDMLLYLFKHVNHSKINNQTKDVQSDMLCERTTISSSEVAKTDTTSITSAPPRTFLQGNLIFPQSRIIICFPPDYYGDSRSSSLLDKLIVLEHSTPLNPKEASDSFSFPNVNSARDQPSMSSSSIHLSTQNLDVYLVESAKENGLDGGVCTPEKQFFSSVKIISVSGIKKDSCSGITMLWQQGSLTGSWMVDRVWSLAVSRDQNRNKIIGKGSEFSSITDADDLEETHCNIRQELILNSSFFLHIQLCCVWINLDNHDYKFLTCLLNNVIDGFSKATIGMDSNINTDIMKKNIAATTTASQASVLVKCDVIDACIRLNETLEVSHLIQKELQGLWDCFRLKIDKFELLSVSNIGESSGTNYLWINHREGDLWGSVFNEEKSPTVAHDKKYSQVIPDICLLTFRNSAMKRGNGEGANALTFGLAGTAITNMWNPLLQQSYTSIIVRCGTIIGPGGRLDWISSILSYFNSSDKERENLENDGTKYKVLFFLDLVDVALGYEPYATAHIVVGSKDPDIRHNCDSEPDIEKDTAVTACLLAASSLSLYNHTNRDSTVDYNIHLKDVGFLISESHVSTSDVDGYSIGYVQRAGYSKIAQVSILQAILRIRGLFWELEFSESHVSLESCRDTTSSLFRLIVQLQQLYAPDVEDSLMHLQSRWNRMRDVSTSSLLSTSVQEEPTCGLLDGILENAFESNPTSDVCSMALVSREQHKLEDILKSGASVDSAAADSSYSKGVGIFLDKPVMPQVIERYYPPDILPSAQLHSINHYPAEHDKCTLDISTHRDTEYRQGGWYVDDGFMIVEDHISTMQKQPEGNSLLDEEFGCENISTADHSPPKGRILLKDMEASWCMYAGLDWAKSKGIDGRDRSTFLELSLVGLCLQYDIYPEGEINVSKLSLTVQDFNLYDRSDDAPWKMVLGNYHSKDHPRESYAKAFKLNLETVRPNPVTPLEDCRLLLELLPLRLHLDQTQLIFLTNFFGNESFDDPSPSSPNILDGSDTSTSLSRRSGKQLVVEEALLPFFQKCVVKPLIVCVDYIPRHFDPASLRRGNYAELLNLVPWKGIDLKLKQVCAIGVYGWNNIFETVIGEWLEDIANNQVRELLKGLPPMKSLFAVSSGTKKLVCLPLKSYKKDHKLLKGMQRGAMAFIKSISIEAVGLGVHLAAGVQEILLQTEYFLASSPSSVPLSEIKRKITSVRANQPENAQEGIQQAYESLSDGFGRTTSGLLGNPLKAYQRGAGAGSALAMAVRGAPAAAIAPFSASARAVHSTLLGLRNSMDPEHKRESIEKYQGPSQS